MLKLHDGFYSKAIERLIKDTSFEVFSSKHLWLGTAESQIRGLIERSQKLEMENQRLRHFSKTTLRKSIETSTRNSDELSMLYSSLVSYCSRF